MKAQNFLEVEITDVSWGNAIIPGTIEPVEKGQKTCYFGNHHIKLKDKGTFCRSVDSVRVITHSDATYIVRNIENLIDKGYGF